MTNVIWMTQLLDTCLRDFVEKKAKEFPAYKALLDSVAFRSSAKAQAAGTEEAKALTSRVSPA